jgi:hypothetical protein
VAASPASAPPAPLAKPKQTLLGIAPIVVVGPAPPPPVKPPAALAISAPPPSSGEATSSPTTTAVTTPSKPYIPKDHPATPAVVISGDVVSTEADISDTKAALGYQPTTGIDEGIGRFVDWYLDYHGLERGQD